MRGCWNLGRLFGLNFYMHPLFLGLAFYLGLIFYGIFRLPFPVNLILASGLAVATILCLFAHELSHALVGYLFKRRPKDVYLIFFGMMVTMEDLDQRSWKNVLIYLAGPLANILIGAIIFLILISGVAIHSIIVTALTLLIIVNLQLAIFNLLPIRPLDGGSILYEILNLAIKNELVAAKIASLIGFILVVGINIFLIFIGKINPWIIALSIFLIIQNWQGLKASILRSKLKCLKVKDIMQPAGYDGGRPICRENDDLLAVFKRMETEGSAIFLVKNSGGSIVGYVSRSMIVSSLDK